MKEIHINDHVAVGSMDIQGMVNAMGPDGMVSVKLDQGGVVTVIPAMITVLEPAPDRDSSGRFQQGHAPALPNPQYEQERADARLLKQDLLNQLAPFLRNAGKYISQIHKPEKKLEAVVKLAPYCMPALSRVEYSDETPRQLSVEQGFMAFMQQHAKKNTDTEG